MHHFSYLYGSKKVSFQSSGLPTKTVPGNVNIITQITCLMSSKPSYHITTSSAKVAYCGNGFALLLSPFPA